MGNAAMVIGRLCRLGLVLALLTLIPFSPAPGHAQSVAPAYWVRQIAVDDLPPARAQYGMATDGAGNVYVYGGRGPDGSPLADFWRWRVRDHAWQRLNGDGMPALVEPHLAVDGAGNVYEFGGISAGADDRHVSSDGHSFGLYRFSPASDQWTDLTPQSPAFGADWPVGREDFGFTYAPADNALWVFAGEGPGNASLGDMWRYDLSAGAWSRVRPRFSAPGGAVIDPREIYAISYDGRGGFYLFGGAYGFTPSNQPLPWRYINDLWYFSIGARRWTLLSGRANAYDPALPLPRHYYGQACDAAGNFYVLAGYLSDTLHENGVIPYFSDDRTILYAQVIAFADDDTPTGDISYALDDFWQYATAAHTWNDLTGRLGELGTAPFIPYVMVRDPGSNALLTFGGYHQNADGLLAPSAEVWSYQLPSLPANPSATATPASSTTHG